LTDPNAKLLDGIVTDQHEVHDARPINPSQQLPDNAETVVSPDPAKRYQVVILASLVLSILVDLTHDAFESV